MIVGSLIRVATAPGTWRVGGVTGAHLEVLSSDRSSVDRRRTVRPNEVTECVVERKVALSLDGQLGTAVTRLGEPPKGPGNCILYDVRCSPPRFRVLSAHEVWRSQTKPDELF